MIKTWIDHSRIWSLIQKSIQWMISVYKNSRTASLIVAIFDFLNRWLMGSYILRFFIVETSKHPKENTRIGAWLDSRYKGLLTAMHSRMKPYIEASLIHKIILSDWLVRVWLIFWVASMIVLPTSLSMIVSFVTVIWLWMIAFIKNESGGPLIAFDGALMIYLIFIIISSLTGFQWKNSLSIGLIHISYIMGLFGWARRGPTKVWIQDLVYTMVGLLLLTSLHGFYQYIVGVEVDPAWVDENLFDDLQVRIYSVFANPNLFATFLVMTIPLAIVQGFNEKRFLLKIFMWLVALLGMVNVAFTYSRGGMLALAFALIIMAVMVERRLLILGLLALIFLPVLMPASIIERLGSITNLADSSSSYRISIYLASFNMAKDYFFGGVGLGGFNDIYFTYAFTASKSFHAHNLFLMILIELGIGGLLSFLAIIVFFTQSVFKGFFHGENMTERRWLIGFLAAIAGASLQGMVEHIWHNYDIMFFYLLILVLGSATYRSMKKKVTIG